MLTVGLHLEPLQSWANATAMLISSFRAAHARDDLVFLISFSSDHDGAERQIANDCVVVPRIPFGRYPSFNKIREIELAAERGIKEYLLLDHDIVAGPRLRDLIGRPQPEFGAVENLKAQLVSAFGPGIVDYIETHAGLPVDEWRYFNTGVVSLNGRAVEGLAERWGPLALAAVESMGGDDKPRPFSNLTMSVAAAGLELELVSYPPAFNQRNYGELVPDPVVVHYNNWDPVNIEVKSQSLSCKRSSKTTARVMGL